MLPIIRVALILCALHLVLLSVGQSTAVAVDIHPGDILVAKLDSSIVRIDPTTGVQTVVSSNSVGSGPLVENPTLAISSKGEVFAGGTANGGPAIIQIDPATGIRTLISDPTKGSGPTSSWPGDGFNSLAVLSDGSLFAGRGLDDSSFVRIDVATGDRTPLPAAAQQLPDITTWGIYLAAADNGDVYVQDMVGPLFQLDPDTGAHHVVSNSIDNPGQGWFPVGDGPSLSVTSSGMTVDPTSGQIYVLNLNGLLSIDPVSGDRAYVSYFWEPDQIGSGIHPSGFGGGLAMSPDGSLFAIDGSNRLIRFDRATGDRTLVTQLSDAPVCVYFSPVIIPFGVPEPSSFALALAGACIWIVTSRVRRPTSRT